jgi:hypothetical protein
MFAADTPHGTDSYRVEVSGWDENEIFFVEESDLDWDKFVGKHISLRRMLPDGALVFLRMLQPIALRQSPPMPYQVAFIGCDPEGHHQFRLNPVHPRYNHEAVNVN